MRMILTKNGIIIHEFVIANSFNETVDALVVTHGGEYYIRDHKVFGEDAIVFIWTQLYAL